MELNDKQKKILDLLKIEEEIATTKVAFLISANLYQTESYLEELKNLGLVIKIPKNNATYWKLNTTNQKNGNSRN